MSTAAAAPAPKGNLFFRNDTVFGVCEALGQDWFSPICSHRLRGAIDLQPDPGGRRTSRPACWCRQPHPLPARLRKARRAKAEAIAPAGLRSANEEAIWRPLTAYGDSYTSPSLFSATRGSA